MCILIEVPNLVAKTDLHKIYINEVPNLIAKTDFERYIYKYCF